MDPIEPLAGGISRRKLEKKIRGKQKSRIQSFSQLLGHAKDAEETEGSVESSGDFESLLDEVHETGDALSGATNMANILSYRKAVQKFLRHTMRRILAVEQKMSGSNILKQKQFTLIKTINRKLESLVADLLEGQKERLAILERVDEINGLIVDLVS